VTYDDAVSMLSETLSVEPQSDVGVSDLHQELNSPDAYIWQGERSCILVRIRDCSTGERVCDASPAAGDLSEILEKATDAIEHFARVHNCTQIQVRAGRDGWERALKAYGYERTAIVLRKLLV